MEPSRHIRDEVLFGYRNGLLTGSELLELDAHLSVCPMCRQRAASSMGVGDHSTAAAFQEMMSESETIAPSESLRWYAAAAALVLAASLGIWFAVSHRHPSVAENISGKESNAAQLADLQQKVEAALRSGALVVPDFVQGLQPKREVLMGSPSAGTPPDGLAPAATAVISQRPLFQWAVLGADWHYRVSVFGPGFQLIAESPDLSSSQWSPLTDLPAGVDLEWQVTASRGDRRLTLPQVPITPPRFRVLDSMTISRLHQLAEQPGVTPLMRAVAYAEAGAVQEARRELERLPDSQRNEKGVQKLLDSLHFSN